jgi:hypothetical protein
MLPVYANQRAGGVDDALKRHLLPRSRWTQGDRRLTPIGAELLRDFAAATEALI